MRVHGRGGTGSGSLLLYQPADPRWNRTGTTGLSLVIESLPAGTPLTWTVTLAMERRRIARTATTRCRAGGRATLRWRDLPDPPRGSDWTDIRRIELAGRPTAGVVLRDLRRLA